MKFLGLVMSEKDCREHVIISIVTRLNKRKMQLIKLIWSLSTINKGRNQSMNDGLCFLSKIEIMQVNALVHYILLLGRNSKMVFAIVALCCGLKMVQSHVRPDGPDEQRNTNQAGPIYCSHDPIIPCIVFATEDSDECNLHQTYVLEFVCVNVC